MQSLVLDATTLCSAFPKPVGRQIQRDNMHHAIEELLTSHQVAIVEGPSGIGKTTLLAQFATKHADSTASIFVNTASKYAYDPELLLSEFVNQLHFVLYKEPLPGGEELSESLLRRLYLAAARKATKSSPLYVIADGICDIPAEQSAIRDTIVDWLPFGVSGFRIVVSGQCLESFLNERRVGLRGFPLPPFSRRECEEALGVPLTTEQLREAFDVTKGHPEFVAAIARQLRPGATVDALLNDLPATLPNLFMKEWASVGTNAITRLALAVIAFSDAGHTLDDLSVFLRHDRAQLCALLSPLTFLTGVENNDIVAFASTSFRQFSQGQLATLRSQVDQLLVDSLLVQPDSPAALIWLPEYLARQNNAVQLIEYLSVDRIALMLERSQMRAPAQEKALLGMETALATHRDADALRLGVVASRITGYTSCSSSRAEIEARMATGQTETALRLAQSAPLKQDRLRLLAVVARRQKQSGVAPQPEIVEQISEFVRICAPTSPEEAADLAADLFYVRPELAIRVTESAEGQGGTGDLDWTLARASVDAAAAGLEDVTIIEKLRSRIKDPEVSRLTSAIWLLMRNYTAQQALAEVDRVPSDADKLYLLRQWTQHVRTGSDPAVVLKHALELCLRSTEYAPNASHLRELATAIVHVKDDGAARDVIGTFDTLAITARDSGPTEDYVRMQLLLARREAALNFKAAGERLLETYFYAAAVKDVAVRAPCFAHFQAELPLTDPDGRMEISDQLHTVIRDGLKADIAAVLVETADHWLATRRIIGALAKACFEQACDVAAALNVEPRRDKALGHAIRVALQQPGARLPLRSILRQIDKFGDAGNAHVTVAAVLERVERIRDDAVVASLFSDVRPFIERASKIEEPSHKVTALLSSWSIVARLTDPELGTLRALIEERLIESWSALDDTWYKTESAFKIASVMADKDRDAALKALKRADELTSIVGTREASEVYEYTLDLAMRAYSGLCAAQLAAPADLEAVAERIRALPSNWTRSVVLSELALMLYRYNMRGQADVIVERDIRPALSLLEKNDAGAFRRAMHQCLPALYVYHRTTALEWASRLPMTWRDAALSELVEFVLNKTAPREPFDAKDSTYRIKYEEAVDVLEILSKVHSDGAVFRGIGAVARSVSARANRRAFTREQREDIVKRATQLANAKLPAPRFIAHEGFLLAAFAEIFRMRRPESGEWETLVARARKLPNLADVVFVVTVIAEACGKAPLRTSLVTEALELVERIPSAHDRAVRYQSVAEAVYASDRGLAKKCLEKAMQWATTVDADESASSVKRSLIDTAYGMDPKWAEALTSALDADPARKASRREIADRMNVLEFKRKMAHEELGEGDCADNPRQMADAAWAHLGAMNANRVAPLLAKERRPLVRAAARVPLPVGYPMLAVAIESAKRSMADAHDAAGLRAMLDGVLMACDFAARVGLTTATHRERELGSTADRASSSRVVRAGDRGGALEALSQFLKRQASGVVKIADPYLGPDEIIEVLALVRMCGLQCEVSIVTSRRHYIESRIEQPWDEVTRSAWKRASDQMPPPTTVVIAGLGAGGDSPIHERWWLTEREGLRVGTSFGSLGDRRESELSVLSVAECRERARDFDECFSRRRRLQAGEQISYLTFEL